MSDDAFKAAQAAHRAGNLAEAETRYRTILTSQPSHVEALYAYGVLFAQTGRLPQSLEHLKRASRLAPDDTRIGRNLALVLQAAGRLDEAEAEFTALAEAEPSSGEHRFGLGLLASARGRYDEAIAQFQQGLRLAPNDAEGHCNLGLVYRAADRNGEAIAAFKQAVALSPAMAKAHGNLGATYFADKCWAEAASAWGRAVELEPGHAEVLADLGIALANLGRLDEAVERFRQAADLQAGNPAIHYNLGRALQELGRFEEAVAAYGLVLSLEPTHVSAHLNSGVIFRRTGQHDQAVEAYHRILELEPGNGRASLNLGKTLREAGRHDEAVESFRRAVDLLPGNADALSELINLRKILCDWTGLAAQEEQLRTLIRDGVTGADPLVFLSVTDSPTEQLQCSRLWGRMMCEDRAAAIRDTVLPPRVMADRPRLRLGYLSAEFRQHPVAQMMAGVFEGHDRDRFETFAYSIGPDDASDMRFRLEDAFDHFVDGWPLRSGDIARRIHEDGIDILVDLTGYIQYCRPEILSCRPAPIQVNLFGFPATMGVEWLDYIVGDRVVTPVEHAPFYAERIVQLPGSYMPVNRLPDLGTPQGTRGDHGLPDEGVVFCAFNNPFKLSPGLLDLWAGILNRVPGSVLWLREDNAQSVANLRREAETRGLDPDRLVFAARVPYEEHLPRHHFADLFLDCLPYNAHTTAVDALWSGLPVLSQVGEGFAGRVAASLLTTLGLPELIVTSRADYADLAVALVSDIPRLAALKAKLQAACAASRLFDTEAYTRDLEAAYLRMAEIHRAGRPPEAFSL